MKKLFSILALLFFTVASAQSGGVFTYVKLTYKPTKINAARNIIAWDSITQKLILVDKNSISPVTSVAGKTGAVTLVKADIGGINNVDNTSDVDKPVSTAQQTALNLKANIASPTLTGDPKAPTPIAGDNDTSLATTAFVGAAITNSAGALIAQTITDGVTTSAPSQDAVFDALALKANDSSVIHKTGDETGLSGRKSFTNSTSNPNLSMSNSGTGGAIRITNNASSGMFVDVTSTGFNGISVNNSSTQSNSTGIQVDINSNGGNGIIINSTSGVTNTSGIKMTLGDISSGSTGFKVTGSNGFLGNFINFQTVGSGINPFIVDYLANVRANSFIKAGGSSTQFLKADGSIDATSYAPLASPTFTGTPFAPTAALNNSSTQIATTAFVMNQDALDAHLAGTETFTGLKSFNTAVKINAVAGTAGLVLTRSGNEGLEITPTTAGNGTIFIANYDRVALAPKPLVFSASKFITNTGNLILGTTNPNETDTGDKLQVLSGGILITEPPSGSFLKVTRSGFGFTSSVSSLEDGFINYTPSGAALNRVFGNGNWIFGSSIGTDLGYKLTVQGTANVTGEITTKTVAATLDFAAAAAQSSSDVTMTYNGAALGDTVLVGLPTGAILAGTVITAWVSAANTITLRCNNYTSSSKDIPSSTYNIKIIK